MLRYYYYYYFPAVYSTISDSLDSLHISVADDGQIVCETLYVVLGWIGAGSRPVL